MGCDIHLYVEVALVAGYTRNDGVVRSLQRALATQPDAAVAERLRSYERRAWETSYACVLADHPPEPAYEIALGAWEERTSQRRGIDADGFWLVDLTKIPVCDDRNYPLFGALTGTIRNHYGNLRGISPPRGLPADVTALVRLDHETFGRDAHTPSWLLAAELLDWNGWDQSLGREGVLREWAHDWLAMVRRYTDRFDPRDVRFVFWFDN